MSYMEYAYSVGYEKAPAYVQRIGHVGAALRRSRRILIMQVHTCMDGGRHEPKCVIARSNNLRTPPADGGMEGAHQRSSSRLHRLGRIRKEPERDRRQPPDRKSTRLNSSHSQ